MTFADFAKHLSKIEATPKRLEITGLLVELIKKADPEEVEKAINLSLGQLAPLYKDIDFNMAEKTMIRAVSKATDEGIADVTAEFKTIGDLGETALKFKSQNSNRPAKPDPALRDKATVQSAKLSVSDAFNRLLSIA